MEDIRDVVNSIVRGCSTAGLHVPDVLAAFIARTILEADRSNFALDKQVTHDSRDEIIISSIERLLEKDRPALETMKMQVDFDTSFLTEDTAAQKTIRVRNKMISSHKMTIVEFEMQDANDYEALTSLYRMIFRFLLEFPPLVSKKQDKAVEREVAAALESVFPRIGLKTFIHLSFEDKGVQLLELARIVLGIRLFNRDQGRGGAGIDRMDEDTLKQSLTVTQDIKNEIEIFEDACSRYQASIVEVHRAKRRLKLDTENAETGSTRNSLAL